MAPDQLTLKGITWRDGRKRVLDDISLEIAGGAFVTLLGPAGSGKSALMRILAGFQSADSGSVALNGAPIDRIPVHRRGFGVMQQHDALFPHLSLAENIAFPLRMRRIKPPARNTLLETAIELVELSDVAGRLPHQAQPAQCQRAMLARALVFEPSVLLLDEPFSRQDQAGHATMRAALRRAHTMLGATTLLATSSAADALALSDAVAVLRAGRVEQVATPDALYDQPQSAFVAELLGDTNRLAGQVMSIEDDLAIIKLACGPQVEARATGPLRPGDRCTLSIRPERIAIAAVSAGEMGETALDATLIEAEYLGDIYRLRLLLGAGASLVVHRAAAAGLRGLKPGQTVAIAWQPHHAHAFRHNAP